MRNSLNKKQIEQLEAMAPEALIAIIYGLIENNKQAKYNLINGFLSLPADILKNIEKEYNKRTRSQRYYDYHETNAFFDELQINVTPLFDKVIHALPEQTEELVVKMMLDIERITKNKDTSSGVWMNYYSMLIDIWMKSLGEQKEGDAVFIATKIINVCEQDCYFGINVFNEHKSVLGLGVLRALRNIFYKKNKTREALDISFIIKDTDFFSTAISNNELPHPRHYLDYAKLLIDDVRADEAISVLMKVDNSTIIHRGLDFDWSKLLIIALIEEGRKEEAKQCCIEAFKRISHHEFYTLYNKLETTTQRSTDLFLEIARQKGQLHYIPFLMDIERLDLVDNYIREDPQEHVGQLFTNFRGSFIREVSSKLFNYGYAWPATLLRRYLVEHTLQSAQSKYYRFAVSDLKKSIDYGVGLNNDPLLSSTSVYLASLYDKHKRKMAFWSLVEEKMPKLSVKGTTK